MLNLELAVLSFLAVDLSVLRLLSYLSYRFVEIPGRKLVAGLLSSKGITDLTKIPPAAKTSPMSPAYGTLAALLSRRTRKITLEASI